MTTINIIKANPKIESVTLEGDSEVLSIKLANGLVIEIDTSRDFQALHYGYGTPDKGWLTFEQMGVPADKIEPRP